MKNFFKILNYIIIFALTLIILFVALVVSAKIPRNAIEENLKESADFYAKRTGLYMIKLKRVYSYIHYFADTRKLNIIYCTDSDKPLESILWANYYKKTNTDMNNDFINVVNNSESPNTEYLRYWHGSILVLRPLLTIFNIEQIYLLNQILLSILALVLIIMLFKKSKKLAFVFLLALILVSVWYVTLCIEYSVTFYIMFITSIAAIIINNKSKENVDNKLFKLFLITGISTCFFDFLTTELLTLFVPLMIILIIRKEDNKIESLKSTFIFIIKSCILWFIGYAGMWVSKWIIASLILHINAFDYVKDSITLRINGLQGLRNHKQLYCHVIERNIDAIPLINLLSLKSYKIEVKFVIAIVISLIVLFINWKDLKNKKFLLVLIFIGITPYVRYLILANHSYRHVMFTFRAQIITIMALLYIIVDCLNYKLLFKKIPIFNNSHDI